MTTVRIQLKGDGDKHWYTLFPNHLHALMEHRKKEKQTSDLLDVETVNPEKLCNITLTLTKIMLTSDVNSNNVNTVC